MEHAGVGGGVDGSGSRPPAIEGQCDICGGLGWNGAAATCVPLNVARCDDCCTVVQLVRPGFVAGGDELCLRERDAVLAVAALAPDGWARFTPQEQKKAFTCNVRPGEPLPSVLLWLSRLLPAVGGQTVRRQHREDREEALVDQRGCRVRQRAEAYWHVGLRLSYTDGLAQKCGEIWKPNGQPLVRITDGVPATCEPSHEIFTL